jgi:hypothetical protein
LNSQKGLFDGWCFFALDRDEPGRFRDRSRRNEDSGRRRQHRDPKVLERTGAVIERPVAVRRLSRDMGVRLRLVVWLSVEPKRDREPSEIHAARLRVGERRQVNFFRGLLEGRVRVFTHDVDERSDADADEVQRQPERPGRSAESMERLEHGVDSTLRRSDTLRLHHVPVARSSV